MLAAEAAVRAWLNDPKTGLNDGHGGGPLARGVYLRSQRSPADGAYAILAVAGSPEPGIAEQSDVLALTRVTCRIFAGTEEMAEESAAAVTRAFGALTGVPAPCADTSIWILSHDQLSGPTYVQAGPDAGEQYCFQVSCQLLLAAY